MFTRPLGALIAVTVLTGCQLFGPPSAQDIAAKPSQSSMKDGHFKIDAQLVSGANHYAGTGEGQMVLRPHAAFKMNVQVDTGTILGRIGVDLVVSGGKEYTRVGNGAWTVSPDTASGGLKPSSASYLGESEIEGAKSWHIQSHDSSGTYDEWVRESDGYLMKYTASQTDGTKLEMTFNEFNTGATVSTPSQQEIAASQYQSLVAPLNSQLSSLNSTLSLDQRLQNLNGFKNDMAQLSGLEQTYVAGLDKIDWPAAMAPDVSALKAAEQAYVAKLQQRSQFTSWSQVTADESAFQAVLTTQSAAINKIRSDLGLPTVSSS